MVILVVTKGEVVRANMFVYLKAQLMLRTDFIIVYVNQRSPFRCSVNKRNHGGT